MLLILTTLRKAEPHHRLTSTVASSLAWVGKPWEILNRKAMLRVYKHRARTMHHI